MSFYATITGEIRYAERADFDAAVAMLKNDGWLDEHGYFLDETDERISTVAGVDPEAQTINIPLACHRNLACALGEDQLFKGGTGRAVWTSTDGCFSGGVIVDGEETCYDLSEWSKKHVLEAGESEPDADADFDKYVEYTSEVEEGFHNEFGA